MHFAAKSRSHKLLYKTGARCLDERLQAWEWLLSHDSCACPSVAGFVLKSSINPKWLVSIHNMNSN